MLYVANPGVLPFRELDPVKIKPGNRTGGSENDVKQYSKAHNKKGNRRIGGVYRPKPPGNLWNPVPPVTMGEWVVGR